MNVDSVTEIILSALDELNAERSPDEQVPVELDTPLTGEDTLLDSLDLITVLSYVEEQLVGEGVDISLTDDASIAAKPWATAESLRDYVLARVE